MNIRTYQPGDDAIQAALYNQAGATLPKFKPATPHEVSRRARGGSLEPATRFYAEHDGQVVGYCVYQPNGRISYPWCLPGHEDQAQPLFDAALRAMRQRGLQRAFAAYRNDWTTVNAFFTRHGFVQARELVNYVLGFMDMPTPSARQGSNLTPVTPADVPAIFALAPEALRVRTADALFQHLFRNPYFAADALFALRSRADDTPVAVGLVITEPTYADPRAVDAAMPCFRLGAFGTEGMTAKRLKGMFSFLARPDKTLFAYGMDLLNHAATRVAAVDDLDCFAAQAPSDVPALLSFYERHFQRQGSFPMFERDLTSA